MTSDTTKNIKDIKDIIPQLLAVVFVMLVIFYPSTKNQTASILQAAGQLGIEEQGKAEMPDSVSGSVVKTDAGQKVVYYGKLRRFSTSGILSFDYYNINKKELTYKNPYVWFWAYLPYYEDYGKVKPMLEFIADHSNVIFKITGAEAGYDEYYDTIVSKIPLRIVSVENIEVYSE